jgi:hypothetical protein
MPAQMRPNRESLIMRLPRLAPASNPISALARGNMAIPASPSHANRVAQVS